MGQAFRLFAIALSCVLAGCAIHPLPENVTGLKTPHIVHHVRCEARDVLLNAIDTSPPDDAEALKQIGIVYSFSLQGTETDGFSPSATFIAPIVNGAWSVNAQAGDTLTRSNVRAFTIVDNYKLLKDMHPDGCKAMPKGPNYQYPITGSIGIEEMIKTFVTLASYTRFGTAAEAPNGPPTMVDTISFTTLLSAGVTPTLTLAPVNSGLTGSTLGLNLSRSDIHQVIVGLALPAAIVSPSQAGPRVVHGAPMVSSQPRAAMLVSAVARPNSAEQVALEAVNNQIIRFQLPRPLIVTP
jgi:hypothetical protein